MTEKMTKQEIFDASCRGIIKQGGGAFERSYCSYRTDDGRGCAVGVLLTEEEVAFLRERDALAIGVREMAYERWLPSRLDDDVDLLRQLQDVHDFTFGKKSLDKSMATWARRARKVAEDERLSPAVLDEYKP